MKIDGVNLGRPMAKAMKTEKKTSEETPVQSQTPKEIEDTKSEEKAAGVLRLLEAGHFKGVAEIRLRINFADQIQALNAETLKSAASDRLEGFNPSVAEQVAGLKEAGLLTETQTTALDTFMTDLQNVQSDFLNNPDSSLTSLIESLQGNLDSLLALLTLPASEPELEEEEPVTEEQSEEVPLTGESVEPSSDELVPTEDAATETTEPNLLLATQADEPDPLAQLVQNFQQSIQTLIDTLKSDLTGVSALPPLSAPAGSGKAYAKFLSIYESLT